MKGRRDERGEGGLKILIVLAVVVYGIFAAIKLVPTWTADKELKHRAQEILKFAGDHEPPWKPEDMQYQIARKAQELEVPLEQDDIKVFEDGGDFRAQFAYKWEVPIVFYTYRKDISVDVSWPKY